MKLIWVLNYTTKSAAADQNFAWIHNQHQDLIGLVLIFRTKIYLVRTRIWSGTMWISKCSQCIWWVCMVPFFTSDGPTMVLGRQMLWSKGAHKGDLANFTLLFFLFSKCQFLFLITFLTYPENNESFGTNNFSTCWCWILCLLFLESSPHGTTSVNYLIIRFDSKSHTCNQKTLVKDREMFFLMLLQGFCIPVQMWWNTGENSGETMPSKTRPPIGSFCRHFLWLTIGRVAVAV